MPRPPLPIGGHGHIHTKREVRSNGQVEHVARTRFRDVNGVLRSVSAKGRTASIAKDEMLKRLDLRLRHPSAFGATFSAEMTVADLATEYVASIRSTSDLRSQTVDRYEQSAKGAITSNLGALRLRQLTSSSVSRFLGNLASEERYSEARNSRVVLSHMARLAIREGALQFNPVKEADVRLRLPGNGSRALNPSEVRELRHLISARMSAKGKSGPNPGPDLLDALNVMLGTGLRISEVLALRTSDISLLSTGQVEIRVSGTVIYEKGVGAKRQESTKTGQNRAVAGPSFVAEVLGRRASLTESGFLWEASGSGRPLQQQNVLRQLRSVLKGTELEWVTSHALRKTAGTMIAKGLGVSAATSALGHSSDAMTRRTYIDQTQIVTDLSVLDALGEW